MARIRELALIQRDLYQAGARGASDEEAAELVARAVRSGVRPIDILLGFITPALRRIGAEWQKAQISVFEEHRFTAFCERIFELVQAAVPGAAPPSAPDPARRLDFLIVSAPDNIHTLGARVFALWLKSLGLSASALYPGVPASELVPLARAMAPRYLGFSIAMEEQLPGVEESVQRLRESGTPLEIILGGRAVREGRMPPVPGARLVVDPLAFIAELPAASSARPPL
jgi:MerR family transcriptional regulator, light-induced transcriptional regulator